MKILKIAVVGTGSRASAHLFTIQKLTDIYQLTAVCDVNSDRVKQVSTNYNVNGYSDVEPMIISEKPDIILIAVPPDGHHIVAYIAAEHGVNIICETPIATTLPCADLMINAAKKNGVKLEIAENVWRFPQERLKKKIVDSGLIGDITQIHCWYSSGSYHGMNAVRTLTQSEVKRVIGYSKGKRSTSSPNLNGQPNWELGVIEFENGATCVYQLPARRSRGNYWEVEATKGCILGNDIYIYHESQASPATRFPIETEYCDVNGVRTIDKLKINTDPPIVWENPYKRYQTAGIDDVARADEHTSLYKAVVEAHDPDYGAINGRKDQELVIAVRESALRGSVFIDIPIASFTQHEQRLHEEYKAKYGYDPLQFEASGIRTQYPRIGVI